MINLELTPGQAISILDLICREEQLYGQEHVPTRITEMRSLLPLIDQGLEAHFNNKGEEDEG